MRKGHYYGGEPVRESMSLMHAHDGYVPHSHEVRPDHRSVAKVDSGRIGDARFGEAMDELRRDHAAQLAQRERLLDSVSRDRARLRGERDEAARRIMALETALAAKATKIEEMARDKRELREALERRVANDWLRDPEQIRHACGSVCNGLPGRSYCAGAVAPPSGQLRSLAEAAATVMREVRTYGTGALGHLANTCSDSETLRREIRAVLGEDSI